MPDNRWIDTEIDDLFEGDPELTQLAHLVRAARPEPPVDPRFEAVLRAKLMREAPAVLGATRAARQRSLRPRTMPARRGGWWHRPTPIAFGGAVLGAALVAAAVFSVMRTPLQDHQVTAGSPVAELHAVSPDNVITVAFNEPMNEAAVVAGLHIRPATEVTTAWQGNNLLITPTHHLAGNTPYTVTIDHSATLAASGQRAASDIRIAFGTAPTPPPAPSIARLAPRALSPVSAGAQLISTGEGTVVATISPATPTPSTPSATASPSSPTASASPAASPSATPTPTLSGELVSLAGGGVVTDLGPAASSAALAPNGLRLVAAVPTATGTSIELVPVDGTQRSLLATLASPVLATGWLNNSTALIAETDRVVSVDLQGNVGGVATLPAGTARAVFSPAGDRVFAGGPGGDGVLIDLATQQSRPLPGSRQVAAFSGDGATVAWVDASARSQRLLISPVSRAVVAAVPLDHPGDSIAALALDRTGSHVAVADQRGAGDAGLDVMSLPSGTVIAHGPQATAPVYSARGDRLAFISGGVAQVATVPGSPTGTAVNVLPDGAATTLTAFVDAQVQADAATLQKLSSSAIDAVGSTPGGLTRAYVISAVANPDGSVSATARLIADPSAGKPDASFADEALGLTVQTGGGYLVSSLNAGALQAEPIGPHVVSVLPIAGPTLVLRVSFDSDLRPLSVPGAIAVATRDGVPLAAVTVYDPNTRTATVTLPVPASTVVALTIGTTLTDVDGQALAGAFMTVSGG